MSQLDTAAKAENRAALPPFADSNILAAERKRLVGYCVRLLGGDIHAADEVAQEALTTAWREQDRLREPAVWQGWLTGIARNHCLRWRRSRAIEGRRTVDMADAETAWGDLRDPHAADPCGELERREIADLLDRALASLPRATHSLMIDRYINDLPVAEIAARRGVREETAVVQLHRGRAALRKALTTPSLRENALALGVLSEKDSEASEWRETTIWCPRCARRKLMGVLQSSDEGKRFILYCPACAPCCNPWEAFMYHAVKAGSHTPWPLDGIQRYRTAVRRLADWWNDFAETAVTYGQAPCHACGTMRPVSAKFPDSLSSPEMRGAPGLDGPCPNCTAHCMMGVDERSFHRPEMQKFWRENPRSILRPTREETTTGIGKVLVTRLESITGSAALEVVCAADTLRVVGIA